MPRPAGTFPTPAPSLQPRSLVSQGLVVGLCALLVTLIVASVLVPNATSSWTWWTPALAVAAL